MLLWLLVVAQFVLAAALVLSIQWIPIPWIALVLSAPGMAVAVWAWAKMGLRKIRVHPSATSATRLIVDGPYGLVRHPMYSGLLWFTAALLVVDFALWRFAIWLLLLFVLIAKATFEERSMVEHFNEYEDYRSRVGMLLPKFR